MLRTPRCRLSAIKYLDRKIPKDMEAAARLIKDDKTKDYKGIHLSNYNLVIRDGKYSLEEFQKGG